MSIEGSMEYFAADRREKIQALSRAKECYSMKLDLLTNATVVDDAIKFVSDKSCISIEPELEKEKHKVDDAVTVDKKHSNDFQRSEEEDKQQQSTATTNAVF